MGTKNPERRPLASIVSSWSLHTLNHYTSLMQNSFRKAFFYLLSFTIADVSSSKELTRFDEHVEFEGVC